jgi:hypothetical protein
MAAESVVKESLTTAADGKAYRTKVYNLDAILAVGYRVRSPRGTQFRRWATTVLREYLVKGFAMDDARLKQAEQWDYFDEWLARIRDIRASEKRFYQKVRDLYTTAIDYDKTSEQAQAFFKKVQNKMLWAVTGKTAAELIESRSDPISPNMGLTSWKGSVVRKGDVGTAKNYLKAEEVEELNRIVVMYLDYAEDQARRRRAVSMAEWADKLDALSPRRVWVGVMAQPVGPKISPFKREGVWARVFAARVRGLSRSIAWTLSQSARLRIGWCSPG